MDELDKEREALIKRRVELEEELKRSEVMLEVTKDITDVLKVVSAQFMLKKLYVDADTDKGTVNMTLTVTKFMWFSLKEKYKKHIERLIELNYKGDLKFNVTINC